MVLQVEGSGVGPVTALSWTLEYNSLRQMNLLVLLKEPGILELLIALVAQDRVYTRAGRQGSVLETVPNHTERAECLPEVHWLQN